jgi:hypothetical protein
MPPIRTQNRQLCTCSQCIAVNPQGRYYTRTTVWRHQQLEVQNLRDRRLFTCRDCLEEHQVPATDIDAHRLEIRLRRGNNQDHLEAATQEVPDFSSVLDESEERTEQDVEGLNEDELMLRDMLHEFVAADNNSEDDERLPTDNQGMINIYTLHICTDYMTSFDPHVHFHVELLRWLKQSNVPRLQYTKLRNLLRTTFGIQLPSARRQASHLQEITDLVPQYFDCCISGCMAYTGKLRDTRKCSYCGESRFRDGSEHPRQQFLYIPLTRRLELQFADRDRSRVLKSYRADLIASHEPGRYRDIWDGQLFRKYQHDKLRLFTRPTDIGLQLSLDGVQIIRKKTYSVTPVILLNLNLPPTERVRIHNILMSILIPGPSEPKDLDSFLYPLVQEMHNLDQGVDNVVDGEFSPTAAGSSFTLRAWITTVTGDGPAAAKAMGFKRPGAALSPCRMCYIQGEKAPQSNIHYVPHRGIFADFNLRTDARTDIEQCATADDEATYTQWGITRKSILTELKSIHFPRSFPIDIMHCILLNITPLLFKLWIGNVKGIDTDADSIPLYRLNARTQETIGDELAAAAKNIPASLGHAPRRIDRHFRGFKAAEWKAWLTLYGTPTLLGHLPDAHLQNFVYLSRIYTTATKHEMCEADVDTVGEMCTTFLRSFEDLYYQNDRQRLKLCTVNLHYLVHLRQHILDTGPACYWWQFPMERMCGVIVPMVRSKSHLSQSLMNALIITEHLNHYNFVMPTQVRDANSPPLPYLTTPISGTISRSTRTKQPRWISDLYRKYDSLGANTNLHIEFYMKCQLTSIVSIGSALQAQLQNGRANFIVCYYDAKKDQFRFGEVEIYALVNGVDAWARIEHLSASHPRLDTTRRVCSYSKQKGKLIWTQLDNIRAAGGIIAHQGRYYCVTDFDIYNKVLRQEG